MAVRWPAKRGDIPALFRGDQTISGDWTFTGNTTVPAATVTAHETALTIAETQITDGSLLARLASNETISGAWAFTNTVTIGPGDSSDQDVLISFNMDRAWVLKAQGNGASNHLALQSTAGGGKSFKIQDDHGDDVFNFRTDNKQLELPDSNIAFPGAAMLHCEASGSVADDGTYEFSGVQGNYNGVYLVHHSSNRQNAIALVFIDTNGDLVQLFAGSATVTGSSNPDTDGQLNVYAGTNNCLAIKNRLGTSDAFICWKLIVA